MSSRSRPTPQEDTGVPKLAARGSEPEEGPGRDQGPGKGRKTRAGVRAGALAHTGVFPQPPCPTPLLLTPSTPGQGQLAGNADPPKIERFLQCIYYYILIKVAARGKHFYVLWPHRCFTKGIQPSLRSEPGPLVPIKLLSSAAWRWEENGKRV